MLMDIYSHREIGCIWFLMKPENYKLILLDPGKNDVSISKTAELQILCSKIKE